MAKNLISASNLKSCVKALSLAPNFSTFSVDGLFLFIETKTFCN